MASPAALLLLCCLAHAWRVVCGSCNASVASAALDAQLAQYERAQAPPRVKVGLALDMRHASVSDKDAAVRVLADLHFQWTDSRLEWNASEWGCEWTLAEAERLWLPDVGPLNAASAAAGPPLRAHLTHDGTVRWLLRLDLQVPLAMQLRSWPDDTQVCTIEFASRAHTVDEMNLTITDSVQSMVAEASAWEAVSLSGWATQREGPGGPRALVEYTLQLRRRGAALALSARSAAAAPALLLLAAAALPPSARSSLAAVAAAIACLWMVSATSRLPSGAQTPRCVSLSAAQTTLCAGAALCAAVVARVARAKGRPPQPLRALVSAASAFCRLAPTEDNEGASGGAAWTATAQLLDRALLAALLLAQLVLFALYA